MSTRFMVLAMLAAGVSFTPAYAQRITDGLLATDEMTFEAWIEPDNTRA